jgi:hypothetical protein
VRALQHLIPEYRPPVHDAATPEPTGRGAPLDPVEWRPYSPQTSTPSV